MTAPLALRSGVADWEDALWLRVLIRCALTGEPPELPVIASLDEWDDVRAAVDAELARRSEGPGNCHSVGLL